MIKKMLLSLGLFLSLSACEWHDLITFPLSRENAQLFQYVATGSPEGVRAALRQGADINSLNLDFVKKGVLVLAIENGHFDLLPLLLERGADINHRSEGGITPLMKACEAGELAWVKKLVENGAEVNLTDSVGWTPAFYAAQASAVKSSKTVNDNIEILKYLKDRGNDLKQINAMHQETLLHQATFNYHNGVFELVKFLLNEQVPLNIQDRNKQSFLHRLLDLRADDIPLEDLEVILKSGVDINLKDDISGSTVLMLVAGDWYETDLVEVLKLLVKYKANVDALDAEGRSALFYAIKAGHLENTKYLISQTDRLNHTTHAGQNALHLAVISDQYTMVKYMVEGGVSLNAKDKEGKTPLALAKEIGTLEIVEYLIEQGATD